MEVTGVDSNPDRVVARQYHSGLAHMRTISVASRKGGQGKSFLTRAIAVLALMEGKSAGIIDTDPQGTVALWGKRRPHNAPTIVHIGSSTVESHLETFRKANADLVAIDTPPNVAPIINVAVTLTDSALIVSGVYGEDLEQVAVLATMMTQLKKPSAIILNRVPQGASALREAKNALSTFRLPICPVAIVQRVSHPYASVDGLTASEREPNSKASEELAQMYAWLGKEGLI
jgi:chromosome partitioning protein